MNEPMTNKRIAYYDNIKFFLVLLVVFGHMVEVSDTGGFDNSIRFFIYTFHMPAFIFVSGLFFDKNNIDKCRSRVLFFFILYIAMKGVKWVTSVVLYHSTSISMFYEVGMAWFLFAMAAWCALLTILRNVNPIVLIVFFFVLALLVGYDDSIGPFLMLSRIIVFFPFFILGTVVDREKLKVIASKSIVKIISLLIFIISFLLIVLVYNDVNWMESMLTGQNPYSTMGKCIEYGFIVRMCTYAVTLIVGISFLLAVPCVDLPITTLGQRSLGVYFWDSVLFEIQMYATPSLHVWQYFALAVMITLLLSTKIVFAPFKKLLAVL